MTEGEGGADTVGDEDVSMSRLQWVDGLAAAQAAHGSARGERRTRCAAKDGGVGGARCKSQSQTAS